MQRSLSPEVPVAQVDSAQSEHSAAGSIQLSSVQPRVKVNTLLGPLPVSHTGNDPGMLPVIIQMAPVIMAILYHHLSGDHFPENSILGDVVCRESPQRKEGTDVAVLVMRVHLYSKVLKRKSISLATLLRGLWLAPWLRPLTVTLPVDTGNVLKIMRITSSKTWEVCTLPAVEFQIGQQCCSACFMSVLSPCAVQACNKAHPKCLGIKLLAVWHACVFHKPSWCATNMICP